MAEVFFSPEADQPARRQSLLATMAAYPDDFASEDDARTFLSSIMTPASRRWSFLTNGKSGTTSAIGLLFALEFGTPLTVNLKRIVDINPDAAAHELGMTGVFRRLFQEAALVESIEHCLRLTTVRHPATRALSGFLYICKTQDLSSPWMVSDRLRMNAMVGFDWERHSRTPDGFERFLDYLRISVGHYAGRIVDAHFRPQVLNIHPDVYRPHVVGKLEALDQFFAEVAERLGQPLPPLAESKLHRNAGERPDIEAFMTPAARRLIAEIYRQDFEVFSYEEGLP